MIEQRGDVVAQPCSGRNAPCACGSGRKFKRCCLERELASAREQCEAALPAWIVTSRRKLHQFEKYVCNVFGLPALLKRFTDGRREPTIPTFDVINSLFHAALLRLPSINALEGDLKEADFQRLIGRRPRQDVKAFSADVIANVLDTLDLKALRDAIEEVLFRAERNKVFREGSWSALRCVALDGWEPFASYHRHCPHCLVRKVEVKREGGEVEKVDQYYHRYVVAMLIHPLIDVVIGIEPVRNDEANREAGEDARHEGELSAAYRLINALHESYGSFIDVLVFDALYANGPVMSLLERCNYGGLIVLKKAGDEPLKEALALWDGQPACKSFDDPEKREHIEFWDVDEIDTLETYKGKIRAIRAVITRKGKKGKKDGKTSTWCFGIVGTRARKVVGVVQGLSIIRGRWHIENTGFNQWVQYWNLAHVYRHTGNALMAVLLLWSLVFDLLQFFIYRRLKRRRDPQDPTDTIRHVVEAMSRDLATFPEPIRWAELLDTS